MQANKTLPWSHSTTWIDINTTDLFTQTPDPFDQESSLAKASKTSGHVQDLTNFVMSFICLIIYIYSFRRYDKPMYKATIFITILYPFGYTLKYFIDIFVIFVIQAQYENNPDVQWWDEVTLDSMQKLMFVVCPGSFYLSMLLKLKYAFKGSVYELKQSMFYTLAVLLTFAVILEITYFTTRKIAKISGGIDENISFHINWIKTIYNLFLGSLFMATFVNKLLKFVMLSSKSRRLDSASMISLSSEIESSIGSSPTSTSRRMVIKEEKKNLSRQQKEHLQIAVKFVLLHGIAITLTNAQFAGWTLLNFELIEGEQSILWFIIVWSWLWDIVLFINYYTIWLSFPFAKPHYNYVCQKCDKCCLNVCSLLVAARMADEANKSTEAIEIMDEKR